MCVHLSCRYLFTKHILMWVASLNLRLQSLISLDFCFVQSFSKLNGKGGCIKRWIPTRQTATKEPRHHSVSKGNSWIALMPHWICIVTVRGSSTNHAPRSADRRQEIEGVGHLVQDYFQAHPEIGRSWRGCWEFFEQDGLLYNLCGFFKPKQLPFLVATQIE